MKKCERARRMTSKSERTNIGWINIWIRQRKIYHLHFTSVPMCSFVHSNEMTQRQTDRWSSSLTLTETKRKLRAVASLFSPDAATTLMIFSCSSTTDGKDVRRCHWKDADESCRRNSRWCETKRKDGCDVIVGALWKTTVRSLFDIHSPPPIKIISFSSFVVLSRPFFFTSFHLFVSFSRSR